MVKSLCALLACFSLHSTQCSTELCHELRYSQNTTRDWHRSSVFGQSSSSQVKVSLARAILVPLATSNLNDAFLPTPREFVRKQPMFKQTEPTYLWGPAVNGAVKATATWDYLNRLLDLLNTATTTKKPSQAAILQEISNTSRLEYSRTQALVKRHVQTGTGGKYFRRVANVYDNGVARVAIKIKPRSWRAARTPPARLLPPPVPPGHHRRQGGGLAEQPRQLAQRTRRRPREAVGSRARGAHPGPLRPGSRCRRCLARRASWLCRGRRRSLRAS